MEKYKELKNKLCEELSRLGNRDLSAQSLDTIDKLAHTIKNLTKIEESEGSYRGSYDGGSNRSYEGGSNRSYEGGSNRSYDGAGYASYRRRYSRDEYSRDGVLDHLYAMMEQAHTEQEKNNIRKAIEAMEK